MCRIIKKRNGRDSDEIKIYKQRFLSAEERKEGKKKKVNFFRGLFHMLEFLRYLFTSELIWVVIELASEREK